MEAFYTPSEAAALLKLHKNTVLQMVKSGRLEATRLGPQTIRIAASAVARLLGQSA